MTPLTLADEVTSTPVVSEPQEFLIPRSLDTHPQDAANLPKTATATTDEVWQKTTQTAFVLCVIAMVWAAGSYWLTVFLYKDALGPVLRFAGTLGVLLSTQLVACLWLFRNPESRLGELIQLSMGLAFFAGVAIMLTDVSSPILSSIWPFMRPDILLLAGLIPLALLADSLLLHLLLLVGLAAFCMTQTSTHEQALLNYLHMTPLAALPTLLWSYRRRSAIGVGACVLLLSGWLFGETARWGFEVHGVFTPACLGAALLFLAEWQHPRGGLADAYRWPGFVALSLCLYFLGQAGMWQSLGHDLFDGQMPGSGGDQLSGRVVCEGFAIGALLVAFVVLLRSYLARRAQYDQTESAGSTLVALARQFWMPVCVLAIVDFITFWHCAPPYFLGWGIVPPLLANLATLLIAVYLVDTGVRERRGFLIAGGAFCAAKACYLVVTTLALVNFEKHRLGTSILFALFPLALFLIAIKWLYFRPAAVEIVAADEEPPEFRLPGWIERCVQWTAARRRWLMPAVCLAQVILFVTIFSIAK